MKEGDKYTGMYVVYAGKYPVNVVKGYKTQEEAVQAVAKLVSGEVKAKKINKHKR